MFKTHHLACIVWITIGLMAITVQGGPVDENEIKKGRDCKTLCDSCGCIGFYCGEECICECNQEKNNGDTECIAAIQANAKENKTPYEILIQGPSSNRFLRNALQFDQNQEVCSAGESGRTKRSTVVIYKPAAENLLNFDGFCERPLKKEDVDLMKRTFRGKRAIGGDSWFTDFSNTLLKPAPIAGMSIDADETEETDDEETADQENADETTEDSILPKIREIRKDIRNALNIGENESIVKGIRKTFNKIGDKALKAVELDGTVKKIRGAITNLLPATEESLDGNNLSTSRKFLNKIKGKIFQPYGEEELKG